MKYKYLIVIIIIVLFSSPVFAFFQGRSIYSTNIIVQNFNDTVNMSYVNNNFLELDGSNANQDINISPYNFIGGTFYGDGSQLSGIESNWNRSGTQVYLANLGDNVITPNNLTVSNNTDLYSNGGSFVIFNKDDTHTDEVVNIFEIRGYEYTGGASGSTTSFIYDNAGQIKTGFSSLRFVIDSQQAVAIIPEGFETKSTSQYLWSDDGNPAGDFDTGLGKESAGVVKVTDGSNGLGSLLVKNGNFTGNITFESNGKIFSNSSSTCLVSPGGNELCVHD